MRLPSFMERIWLGWIEPKFCSFVILMLLAVLIISIILQRNLRSWWRRIHSSVVVTCSGWWTLDTMTDSPSLLTWRRRSARSTTTGTTPAWLGWWRCPASSSCVSTSPTASHSACAATSSVVTVECSVLMVAPASTTPPGHQTSSSARPETM